MWILGAFVGRTGWDIKGNYNPARRNRIHNQLLQLPHQLLSETVTLWKQEFKQLCKHNTINMRISTVAFALMAAVASAQSFDSLLAVAPKW
jgi:hypothetical protein